MKRIFSLLVLCLMMNATMAQSKDEKAVTAVVEQMRKAMVDGDSTTLEKLCDDRLTYGHSGGALPQDKKAFVSDIASGRSDFVTLDLTEQTVTVAGETAVVRHRLMADTNDLGKGAGKVDLRIILVWHKTKGEWKLLARQAVKTAH